MPHREEDGAGGKTVATARPAQVGIVWLVCCCLAGAAHAASLAPSGSMCAFGCVSEGLNPTDGGADVRTFADPKIFSDQDFIGDYRVTPEIFPEFKTSPALPFAPVGTPGTVIDPSPGK
ncbi:hypothetical protein [Pseudoruegeria sp. SK021]|uniref:hypothetical protein n=1 Tax=Pseudoruegeria sp. SK021 TaxID=1933035 RepID=UPI000A237F6B|nr:hypothetical protein [Pseudoruegeria sp. SK021]OSP54150.1 hypothetical protein BV911_13925 [Pseudoruegeria sp. SK021]